MKIVYHKEEEKARKTRAITGYFVKYVKWQVLYKYYNSAIF